MLMLTTYPGEAIKIGDDTVHLLHVDRGLRMLLCCVEPKLGRSRFARVSAGGRIAVGAPAFVVLRQLDPGTMKLRFAIDAPSHVLITRAPSAMATALLQEVR